METEQKYRVAPPGFTAEQWKTFNEDGIIFIEDAISEAEIQTYIDAIDRVAATHPKYTPGGHLHVENIVERDPVFTNLIDNDGMSDMRMTFSANSSNSIRVSFFCVHPAVNSTISGTRTEHVHFPTVYFHPNCRCKSKLGIG